MKERIYRNIFLVLSVCFILISAFGLYDRLAVYVTEKPFLFLLFEMAGFYAAVVCILHFVKNRWYAWGISILTAAFLLQLHQALIPLLISGVYVVILLIMGGSLRRAICHVLYKDRVQECREEQWMKNFMAGCLAMVLCVCLLSLFHAGSIKQLRFLSLVFGAAAAMEHLCYYRKHKPCLSDIQSLNCNFLLAVPFVVLVLQACRMNIAVDYDSLHYGLRSAFILDNGHGIYENLGNINVVYTYPKGFEILTLPLSGTGIYGIFLSFNLWITLGIFLAVFCLVKKLVQKTGNRSEKCRERALWAVSVTALIPAVTNMGITAKSDSITLLLQLVMIYFLVDGRLWMAAVPCMMSFIMKPTAPVFSVAAFVPVFLMKIRMIKNREPESCCFFLTAAAAWVLVWYRTYMLTGYPLTSVFTGIWELLGFRCRQPFSFSGIPSHETGVSFLRRLFGLFLCPAGEDMDHVMIAWGTVLILVLFLSAVTVWVRETKRAKMAAAYWASFIAVTIVSFYALAKLWQVDGNYFLLFYCLTVAGGITFWPGSVKTIRVLIPAMIFGGVITGLTNWSGTQGLTPVKFSCGIYDNRRIAMEKMASEGNAGIWNTLASDPNIRVLAFGEHPKVLSFPCNVQSYYDVTGSGGNVRLVKTLDNFKTFLKYAKIDYIYVERGYLDGESRAAEIIRYMTEDQSFSDVINESGNLLGRVFLEER